MTGADGVRTVSSREVSTLSSDLENVSPLPTHDGVAGLVAGAVSMALGQYVSVRGAAVLVALAVTGTSPGSAGATRPEPSSPWSWVAHRDSA
ncbi:MAG: hypothetical protein JWP46_1809 [Modestobacter sp.]|nr:hypothetical protein [Modestobacter sp.]